MLAHFPAALIPDAEKYTIMAHYFLKQQPVKQGSAQKFKGNPEHDNEYLGGEHGENDKGDYCGTDERTLS